jgi:hypothetical protein
MIDGLEWQGLQNIFMTTLTLRRYENGHLEWANVAASLTGLLGQRTVVEPEIRSTKIHFGRRIET